MIFKLENQFVINMDKNKDIPYQKKYKKYMNGY